ncbi:hypothetical protein MRX96_044625 [Rhipicephalus microplus]
MEKKKIIRITRGRKQIKIDEADSKRQLRKRVVTGRACPAARGVTHDVTRCSRRRLFASSGALRATGHETRDARVAFASLPEYHFMSYSPALIATSSVAAAVHGLRGHLFTTTAQDELTSALERITHVRTVDIRRCVLEIETLMASNIAALGQPQSQAKGDSATLTLYGTNISNALEAPSGADPNFSQPDTPTDVQDITF